MLSGWEGWGNSSAAHMEGKGQGCQIFSFACFFFRKSQRSDSPLPTLLPTTFFKSSDNWILKYWQLVQGGGKHPESQISKSHGPPVCDF